MWATHFTVYFNKKTRSTRSILHREKHNSKSLCICISYKYCKITLLKAIWILGIHIPFREHSQKPHTKMGKGVSLFVTQVYKALGTFIKDNIQRGISTKLRVTQLTLGKLVRTKQSSHRNCIGMYIKIYQYLCKKLNWTGT